MAGNGGYTFSGQDWNPKRLKTHIGNRCSQLIGGLFNDDPEKVQEVTAELAAAGKEFVAAMKREATTTSGAGGRSARQTAGAGRG